MLYGIFYGILIMSMVSMGCYLFRAHKWSKWFCGPVMWIFWTTMWVADWCGVWWRRWRKRQYLRNSRALIRLCSTRQIYYTTRDRALSMIHNTKFEAVSMSDLGLDGYPFPDYIDAEDYPYYCPKEIYSLYPAY